MITFETDRILTFALCGFALILWWCSPLFLKRATWRSWYRLAMFGALAGVVVAIVFSWWRLERGLTRTYYPSIYFSGMPAKNSLRNDRIVNFDTSDFYDWEEFSGSPFSVRWEGVIYLPSEAHIPVIESSCLTSLKIDDALIRIPPASLDVGAPEGRKGLGSGWSYDETSSKTQQTFVWSSDDASDIYLGVSAISDMLLTFRAVAFDYPNSPVQQVEVAVNGTVLDTVAMPKEWQWDTYTVAIPQSIFQQGIDGIAWIRFRYSNAERPAEIIEGAQETRKLAIALDSISVTPARETAAATTPPSVSPGFHRMTLLAQSDGAAPFIRLGWTVGRNTPVSLIPEDHLFPEDTGTLKHIEQRLRWERIVFNLLFFVKLLVLLVVAAILPIRLAPYANASGMARLRRYLDTHIRAKWRAAVLRGVRAVSTVNAANFSGRYDVWLIAALRPLLFLAYFRMEKFFLYAWDDQHGYFAVAMGLIKLDPIVERFTFGFPVLLLPFIKIFNPTDFSEIVLPFSIFNAAVLGTLGIYFVYRITILLVNDRYAARIATLLYVIHPFFPLFAKTRQNAIYLDPVYWGDIVGWNMTSDQVSVIFLLLAIFLFLKYMTSSNGMILAGAALGYAGLIRMPSLAILLALLYLGFLHRISWKQYLILFVSMGVVLSPQLLYNWHYFGSPLTFGYTALKHIKAFWTPSLVPQQLATILWDHAALFVIFVTTFLIYAHRKIGGFLILWVAVFTTYYAGYEALYNDPIRFLLPIRPALCIGAGILLASGKDVIERCFLFASLLLLLLVNSYRATLSLPSDMIPTAFAILGVLFVSFGILLRVRGIVLASLCLYIVCALHLLKLSVPAWGVLATIIFLINLAQLKRWGQFAPYEPVGDGESAR